MRHREMQPLNAEQANMLLAAASSTRLEALYVLALTMGMREGELLALRWRDVDLDARHIDARHIDARHIDARHIDARHIDARHIDARHIDARHIHVQHTLQQIPERPPEIASAKTSQSRRKIALTSKAIEALRRHRALQIEERMRIGPVWTDWDLVYCNTVGNPLMEVRYCTVDCAHS
jgi:integrase